MVVHVTAANKRVVAPSLARATSALRSKTVKRTFNRFSPLFSAPVRVPMERRFAFLFLVVGIAEEALTL